MDSKQMIRLIIKLIGFVYWLGFLYVGSLIVMDWSGFMTQYNIETPIYRIGGLFCDALFSILLEKTKS